MIQTPPPPQNAPREPEKLEPLKEEPSPWSNSADFSDQEIYLMTPDDIARLAPEITLVVGIPSTNIRKVPLFEALVDWILGAGFSRYEISPNFSYLQDRTLYLIPADQRVYLQARTNHFKELERSAKSS